MAQTSRNIDLHAKQRDYARYGVREYVVWNLTDRRVHWLDLRRSAETNVDADGILRSIEFPGLWIDTTAAFEGDVPALVAAVSAGLATKEHQQFVDRLRAEEKKPI